MLPVQEIWRKLVKSFKGVGCDPFFFSSIQAFRAHNISTFLAAKRVWLDLMFAGLLFKHQAIAFLHKKLDRG